MPDDTGEAAGDAGDGAADAVEAAADAADGAGEADAAAEERARTVDAGPQAGEPWRVLVPLQVLEGETVPDGIAGLVGELAVTILGYYVVPEQTEPDQARNQFEEKAHQALDDVAAVFEEAGADVETRMVFTRDVHQSLDRVAREAGCQVVLLPNPVSTVERVLVPLGSAINTARIMDFVAGLVDDTVVVTVWRAAATEDEAPREEGVVDRARSRLIDDGVPRGTIDDVVEVTDESVDAIVEAAEGHDAIVMGESEPTVASFVLGDLHDRVAERSLTPVFVVQGPGESTDGDGGDEP